MDKIYNRMGRLLPIATNKQRTNNKQHPKNRDIQISFVELFLFCLKSGVCHYIYKKKQYSLVCKALVCQKGRGF